MKRKIDVTRLAVTWVLCALMLYGIAGVTGYFHHPRDGGPLTSRTASETLDFVFPGASAGWRNPAGRAAHGWWFRTAVVSGESAGMPYSEQVLKVGWPFTVARGFVRVTAGVPGLEGARLLTGKPGSEALRFWPLQPVWPGIVFDSLLLAMLAFRFWLLKTPTGRANDHAQG